MRSPVRSVRGRLTVAVTLLVGLLAVAVAAIAPGIVRAALVDDLLDAQGSGMAAARGPADAPELAASTTTVPALIAVLDDSQLTELFGPMLADLVHALDGTGALDELRAFRDDGTIVITPSPGAFAVVGPDGSLDVRGGYDQRGPVLSSRQLQQLVQDLHTSWIDPPIFDKPLGGRSGGPSVEDWNRVFDELLGGLDLDLDQAFPDGFDPEQAWPWLFDQTAAPPLRPAAETSAPPTAAPPTDVELPVSREELAYGVRSVDGVEMIVAAPTDSVERSVDRLRTALWGATPLMMAVVAGLTWWLAGRSLRPVRLITDRTASIRSGTLHERVPVPTSDDEIADLATEMNEMLDRLQREDARRRQFVSDASHELRSPIAAIRTQAEATLAESPDGEAAELATGVLAEAERLSVVVADLLALARHDEGMAPPGTLVDLDDVVIAEARRTRAVPIDVSAVSAGRVRGRSDELARVVAHLLDNAARHARSAVRVALHTDRDVVTLTVDDDGPGVPEDERLRVFERFVRLDEARLRDTGGAGLGLAVVAAVVTATGGTASVVESPLGGARFEVRLPAAS